MIRLVTILALLIACGDDDRMMGLDAGPGFDGGAGFDAGPGFDGGADSGPSGADAGPGFDAGPPSDLVDPACTDGMYTETLPNPTADISDITFDGDIGGFIDAILDRRYPVGAALVRGGRMYRNFGEDCDLLFAGTPSSGDDIHQRLNTIVHECGHLYDFFLSSGASDSYFITGDLTLTCERGDTTARGGDTFERALLTSDSYQPARPPGSGRGFDSYADVYLIGDGSEQGFNVLFEEAVQYVNSLATEYAFADQMSPGQSTSARDGILTFVWYVTRYLKIAREEYPSAYERITNACWRDAILQWWGRAWLYLEATEGMPSLGIDDEALYDLATDPVLLSEIQRLRELDGCAAR